MRPSVWGVVVADGEAALHLLEVRQAVRVAPGLHARIGCPPLVIERVAALEDHPVDAARAAEHLATSVIHPAAVHERLRFAFVLPVVEPTADREHQRRRHVDEHVPPRVRAAGFEHQDARAGVGAEPVGQRRAGRATTDDHVVVSLLGHRQAITIAAARSATICPSTLWSRSPGRRYAGP